jgi:hypothetical protein
MFSVIHTVGNTVRSIARHAKLDDFDAKTELAFIHWSADVQEKKAYVKVDQVLMHAMLLMKEVAESPHKETRNEWYFASLNLALDRILDRLADTLVRLDKEFRWGLAERTKVTCQQLRAMWSRKFKSIRVTNRTLKKDLPLRLEQIYTIAQCMLPGDLRPKTMQLGGAHNPASMFVQYFHQLQIIMQSHHICLSESAELLGRVKYTTPIVFLAEYVDDTPDEPPVVPLQEDNESVKTRFMNQVQRDLIRRAIHLAQPTQPTQPTQPLQAPGGDEEEQEITMPPPGLKRARTIHA